MSLIFNHLKEFKTQSNRIILTKEDVLFCYNEAKERVGNSNKDIDKHFIGLKGEFALSRFLNIPFNRQIYENSGDNGEPDLFLGDTGLEVKTSTYDALEKWLILNNLRIKSDFLILCYTNPTLTLDPTFVDIIGYIHKSQFTKYVTSKPIKERNRLVVTSENLLNINFLKEHNNFLQKVYDDIHIEIRKLNV